MIHLVMLHALGALNPKPGPPPGAVESKTNEVLGWLWWFGLAACVAGLFIAFARMAIAHRRGMGGGEAVGEVGWVAVALVGFGSTMAIVGALGS